MTNEELQVVMAEQMTAMVAMSKELRMQFNDNAALRAELQKSNNQAGAYKRELQNESNILARTQVENTKAIDKNRQLIYKNSALSKTIQELEVRVQNQRGIPFSKLK